ncbi:MAG: NmrA family transcriptional regulator [Haliea sp.]|nr:NmrA family transcriptional regulator [Haliea sp.]|tara:strand:+ start:110312 stop:111151 length:840 start_codon:yes stop_codon:yes gene_type:complete
MDKQTDGLTLVLGGTGKTGRRVADILRAQGSSVRVASRTSRVRFDWHDRETWADALAGVSGVYLAYSPDLAVPGTRAVIAEFVEKAVSHGVTRLVLLSGRGEEEAQACEAIVQQASLDWTILRASWFMQNFSEGDFLGMVRAGAITLPVREVPEPFIDVRDIAEVAVAALTEVGHASRIYELTGPRLLTFQELAGEISEFAGREVRLVPVSETEFAHTLESVGTPAEVVWLMNYLFTTVLDGRNACLANGVERALGRRPRDFAEFARDAAATGAWRAVG